MAESLLDRVSAEEQAFLRAIHTDLEDDGHRLIYADWLEEHGGRPSQARAIRLSIFVDRHEEGDERNSLLNQLFDLYRWPPFDLYHPVFWFLQAQGDVVLEATRRGMPARARLRRHDCLGRHGPALVMLCPGVDLRVYSGAQESLEAQANAVRAMVKTWPFQPRSVRLNRTGTIFTPGDTLDMDLEPDPTWPADRPQPVVGYEVFTPRVLPAGSGILWPTPAPTSGDGSWGQAQLTSARSAGTFDDVAEAIRGEVNRQPGQLELDGGPSPGDLFDHMVLPEEDEDD